MKIAIINSNNEARYILDHSNGNVTDGLRADTEAVFVDHPLITTPANLPVANTCIGVKNFFVNPQLRERLLKEELNIAEGKSSSALFALFNGEKFSDWMEISQSRKFLNGNVGPDVIWGNGIGVKVNGDVNQIIPSIGNLQTILKEMNYRGEVYCEIAEDFQLTAVSFGHFYAHFAMFCELSRKGIEQVLDFIFGESTDCELKDLLCVSNLISHQPFPTIISNNTPVLIAPRNAEKHLWRHRVGGLCEVALITIVGNHIDQVRYRMKITIKNMRKAAEQIQFRTDYGYYGKFVIMMDRYSELLKPASRQGTPA